MLIMASLIVSGIYSALPIEVFANLIDERKPLIHNVGMSENTSNATSTVSSNNTIILNATEVREEEGEDETAEKVKDEAYGWVDSTGAENPDLNLSLIHI